MSAPCPVYAWCDVDHSHDQDATDAGYHRMLGKREPFRYDFILDEDGPRIVLIDSYEWYIHPGDEHEIEEAIECLVKMRDDWAFFQQGVPAGALRRPVSVDENLRALDG